MIDTKSDPFASFDDALKYVALTSGLYINETVVLLPQTLPHSPSVLSLLPLSLGIIGLVFNVLAMLIFTTSKTYRENSFRCYIYAFVIVNCACILTHSWFYLIFYLANPIYFCKYLQYLQQATTTTSLWIMVILSLERSFTFSKPFIVQKLIQPRTICFVLLLVTSFCFLIHIDELISVDVKAFRWVNFAYGLCSVERHSRFSSVRIKIITHSHSFILPFLLNSILDIYISYKICQRRQRSTIKSVLLLSSTSSTKRKYHQRLKKSTAHEITLTLLCQSMWLLLAYFPRHLYYFLIQFNLIHDHDRDNSTFSLLLRLCLLIYFAFSPVLYFIISPTLRREIRSYVCTIWQGNQRRSLTRMSNGHSLFRDFLQRRRPQRSSEPIHLTVLVTSSERVQRKSFFQRRSLPVKIEYLSKSVPCLFEYEHDNQSHSNLRKERSTTLRE